MPRREPRRKRERYSVFLNISYDSAFENLYLAYIAGLSAFGLIPRATLEIPTSRRKRVRMRIADSGNGFDSQSRGFHAGLGLLSMKERTRLVGGEFSVAPRAPRGTKIEVRIPCA